jgi:hypothetical protein
LRHVTWLLAPAIAALILGCGQVKAGYTTITPPGAIFSRATGVSGGNVVGYDQIVTSATEYGFLYQQSVPEPPGLVLVSIALATMAGYFGLRRRRPSATARPATRE